MKVMRALCLVLTFAFAHGHSKKYEDAENVKVLVTNLHPFFNVGEKYDFYHLPWPCKPEGDVVDAEQGMAEAMVGDVDEISLYEIKYGQNLEKKKICSKQDLNEEEVQKFVHAVKHNYEFEMYMDDLPVDREVGTYDRSWSEADRKYYLYTHLHFDIEFNEGRIIAFKVTPGQPVALDSTGEGMKLDHPFSYSVQWRENTEVSFAERAAYHLQANPTRHQMEAHWLWILNSSLLVVLLTGLLSMILLRTLKNDVSRYLQLDQLDAEEAREAREDGEFNEIDDSGWKRIRTDVFREPKYPLIFSAIIGAGAQILMIVMFLLLLSVVGYFYPGNHGRLYIAMLGLYCITSYVAGFVASSNYKQFTKEETVDWMYSCAVTGSLFAVPLLAVFSTVNTIAWGMGSTTAIPAKYIMAIILMWAFITFPLTAYGSYRGSKVERQKWPIRPKFIARPLPDDLPWYYSPVVQVLVAGFLPFMAIYVEVHTLFNSVWVPHQAYTLFGILLLTFGILLIVTSFVVILLCYFQLTAEDYRWWWASLLRGGSCGIFLYAYAIFYWSYSEMTGPLQGAMYFGYTLMISYGFALMLSSVGYWSSKWFITRIYQAIKSD